MARWGSLNVALTAWRDAYVALFAKYGIHRGTDSDGALADSNHGSNSQHQRDPDGTVDANDMDVNVLGSSNPTGTDAERRVIEAMKLDFENDPHDRAQLWISYREIANRDVGDWRERGYSGPSPHDHHVHWESRQSREDDGRPWPMPRTEAVLRELLGEDDDMPEISDLTAALKDDKDSYALIMRATPWKYTGGGIPAGMNALNVLATIHANTAATAGLVKALASKDEVDETKLGREIGAALAPAVADAVLRSLPAGATLTADEVQARVEAGVKAVVSGWVAK